MARPHWPDLSQRPRARHAVDTVVVLAMAAFAALVSQRWTGLHLDSMFYATLSLFGDDVTDRAVIDSYYGTRLGYIVPVRALTTLLGPWIGFEVWRYLLLVGLAAGLYVIGTRFTRRLLAAPVVLILLMSSVVLTYVGNTYLTGMALAGTALVMGAALFRGVPSHLVAGVTLGWLAMGNPAGLLLAASLWVAMRIHGRPAWRNTMLAVAAAAGTFLVLLGLGRLVLPSLDWLATYLEWNSKLNYADFASKDPVWLGDISLLVPAMVLLISIGAWVNDRTQRSSQLALIVSATSVGFLLTFSPLMGGVPLEAPMYQAMLWPPALASLALVVTGRMADRTPLPWPTGIVAAVGLAAVVAAGHFTGIVPFGLGIVLALVAAALMVLAVWLVRRVDATWAVAALLVGLVVVMSVSQVLQNSRRTIGLYPSTPYSWAFVDNPIEAKMRESVNAEEWLIANTADTDQVLVWVGGDWVNGDRELYMLAGMQLWGENRVGLDPTLTDADLARLEELRPTVIQMVAPSMDQVADFWSSLPAGTRPTTPTCYDFPWPGPTFSVAHSCLTLLDWDAA